MIVLRPMNLRWINDSPDDPHDLCAHADVEFRIGQDVLLDPATAQSQSLTATAAALYLLRTLDSPHTRATPVGDHLFPCCGFNMYEVPGVPDEVVVCGCPNGHDFEVLPAPDGPITGYAPGGRIMVRAADGREWQVARADWQAAVFAFADAVSAFYAACSPKRPADDESARGFAAFAAEWARRRGRELGWGRGARPGIHG